MITAEGIGTALRERGLLRRIEGEQGGKEIRWLTSDSRKAKADTLFI